MKLSELIKEILTLKIRGTLDLEINNLTQDSRNVEAGNLFFCVKGTVTDGHLFLKQVAEKGAVAVIVQDWPAECHNLTIIQVPDVSRSSSKSPGPFMITRIANYN